MNDPIAEIERESIRQETAQIERLMGGRAAVSGSAPLDRPDSEGWWWEFWGGSWMAWKVVRKDCHLYVLWGNDRVGVQRINKPKMRDGGQWFKATLPSWPNGRRQPPEGQPQ
jgi:hypothetical protein